MMCVCFLNKLISRLSSFFPQGENIVNASFPLEGLVLLLLINSVSILDIKMFAKATATK